jgi:outer membrane autotransporter protein
VTISDQVHHHHEPGVPCLDEIWYSGYGHIGKTQFDGNVSESDPSASGHLFGKSWCSGPETATGIFYNYERQNLRSDRVLSKIESDSHRVGMYLRNQSGMYHTLITAFGGWDKNEGQRVVNVNTISEFNESAYQSWNAGLYFEQGMTYGVEFLGVQPYTSLQILHVSTDGFTEQGGPLTSLAVNDLDVDSVRLMAGSRIKMLNHAAGIRLGVDSAAVLEAGDNDVDYQASLLSTPGLAFQAKGADLGQVFFTIGPTLDWSVGAIDMFLNYRATLGRDSAIHTGQGGAEIIW